MNMVVLIVMLYVFAATSRGFLKLLFVGGAENCIEKQKEAANKLIEKYNEDPDKMAFSYWCVWLSLLIFRVCLLILTGAYFFSLI